MRGLNGIGKIWPLAIVGFVAGVVAYWQWGVKPDLSPVVTYGAPSLTKFVPNEVTEGDATELCFHGVVWYRVTCPSKLITHLTPSQGDRLDLPTYPIAVPPSAGPIGKKCRPWIAPNIGDRSSQMIFSGFAEHLCGKPSDPVRIITLLPAVPITINKRK